MKIWHERQATGNPLVDAYMNGDPLVAPLYEPLDYQARCAYAASRFDDAHRAALSAVLRRYGSEVTGISPMAEALLTKLQDPRCMVVVTGQQAGLFTGPLYTLYKALSAITYAQSFEKSLGIPVVPVFWVASEDHDFEEVATSLYVGRDGEVHRASLRERPPLRTPVGTHAIDSAEFERLMTQLSVTLPDGEFAQPLLREIEQAYQSTENMADFCAALLARWLRAFPILFLNPMETDARQLARPAFASVLENPDAYVDAVKRGEADVRRAGFSPQVDVQPKHSLLYLLEDGKRLALDIEGPGVFSLRDTDIRYTTDTLLDRLARHPEDFSAGVLYRPVVQDFMMPVLAYVGGAAEIAYHGMMRHVFRQADRQTPPLLLRHRATVIPGAAARAMARHDIPLVDALARDVLQEVIERDIRPTLDDVTADLQTRMLAVLAEQSPYFSSVSAHMEVALRKTEKAIERDLARLASRARLALRRERQETVQVLTALTSWLHPQGTLQERTLSPLSILAKYGVGWLDAWAAQMAPDGQYTTYIQW